MGAVTIAFRCSPRRHIIDEGACSASRWMEIAALNRDLRIAPHGCSLEPLESEVAARSHSCRDRLICCDVPVLHCESGGDSAHRPCGCAVPAVPDRHRSGPGGRCRYARESEGRDDAGDRVGRCRVSRNIRGPRVPYRGLGVKRKLAPEIRRLANWDHSGCECSRCASKEADGHHHESVVDDGGVWRRDREGWNSRRSCGLCPGRAVCVAITTSAEAEVRERMKGGAY